MSIVLRENIDWVGYVDWTVRDFHSYNTDRGATYNAYLVRDEKTALIDTVKAPFVNDLIQKVTTLTDMKSIRYIICNHAEPDHSGGLPRVIKECPNATLVCTKKCEAALGKHYDTSGWNFHIVKTGDTLSLGKWTLQFIETPMVHWPESMFTYIPEEKLLFSMDAFGQHYATIRRFDDEVSFQALMEEAKTYYANILMPYGKFIAATMDEVAKLDIDMIAPSHGLVFRSNIDKIIEAYKGWIVHKPKPKVLVIYDTMWNSTGEMAKAILEGASIPGVETDLIHVRLSNLTRIATDMLDAAGVAIGSSILNREMMPMIGATLIYLKGLRPSGKAGFAFGSYGWSQGGMRNLVDYMKALDWEIVRDTISSQFKPTPEILDECRAAGKQLAEKALELANNHAN